MNEKSCIRSFQLRGRRSNTIWGPFEGVHVKKDSHTRTRIGNILVDCPGKGLLGGYFVCWTEDQLPYSERVLVEALPVSDRRKSRESLVGNMVVDQSLQGKHFNGYLRVWTVYLGAQVQVVPKLQTVSTYLQANARAWPERT